MRKVFLSHSFHDQDAKLVANVEALMRSHGVIATNGRTLGGGGLTPEIAKEIDAADAMVALLTVRQSDPPNLTHPWVVAEFGHARLSQEKPAIGIYQAGVPVQGFDQGNEYVPYDPADPLPAFLKLSATLGRWRRQEGRLFKVQVLPMTVAKRMRANLDRVTCEYRFQIDGVETPWHRAMVSKEIGGVMAHLRVPDEAAMVQLRATGPELACESDYTPVAMPIQFDQ